MDQILKRARFGDREAFEALVGPEIPKLRRLLRRFSGPPSEVDDLMQDTLLKAYEKIGGFRGESAFGSWLLRIGTRIAIDNLRKQTRWPVDAQVRARAELHATEESEQAMTSWFASAQHHFDAREHIAFCFTCVGRSLPPHEQAALIVRDVLAFSNREAAKILDCTESVLRHNLSAARSSMQKSYDGLCGIVSKSGVCYQCDGLRKVTQPPRQGPAVPSFGTSSSSRDDRYRLRLQVVQQADPDTGYAQAFHDMVWGVLARLPG